MKNFKYFLILLLFSIISSCSSYFNTQYKENDITLNNITSISHLMVSLLKDYDEELQNKNDEYITENIAYYINEFLKNYDIDFDILTEKDRIHLNIQNINTAEFINKISLNNKYDLNNKIIYLTEENKTVFNINVDNYLILFDILPFLNNETFISYTAIYNRDTSEEEFLELIEYVAGKDIASSLKTSLIEVQTKNDIIQFSVLDFMLLHKPIIFTID